MSDRFDHTLEHKLESKSGRVRDAGAVRRIELISGTGRRRPWSSDDKARILLESLEPGANVSEVARRHGMSPQQLFCWRRQARTEQSPSAPAKRGRPRRDRDVHEPACEGSAFAPVVVAASTASQMPAALTPAAASPFAPIEIAIGDCIVRIAGGVEAALLIAVLRAVRKAS